MRDENYITPVPPEGFCKNRYCESGRVTHEALVRGYCEPCASIRKPRTGRAPNYEVDYGRVGWGSMVAIDVDNDRW